MTAVHLSGMSIIKPAYLVPFFSVLSLSIMLFVDFLIGEEAEFINAFSVLQRTLGLQPAAPDSMVAQNLGYAGELGVVLIVNLVIGGTIAAVVRSVFRRWQSEDGVQSPYNSDEDDR